MQLSQPVSEGATPLHLGPLQRPLHLLVAGWTKPGYVGSSPSRQLRLMASAEKGGMLEARSSVEHYRTWHYLMWHGLTWQCLMWPCQTWHYLARYRLELPLGRQPGWGASGRGWQLVRSWRSS